MADRQIVRNTENPSLEILDRGVLSIGIPPPLALSKYSDKRLLKKIVRHKLMFLQNRTKVCKHTGIKSRIQYGKCAIVPEQKALEQRLIARRNGLLRSGIWSGFSHASAR